MTTELSLDVETITVRIRGRAGEAPWGVGLTNPYVRHATISALCQVCGQRRGARRNLNQCDDGAFYSVDIWDNPCGHVDYYEAVAKEANKLIELKQDDLLRRLETGDVVEVRFRANRGRGRVGGIDLEKRQAYLINVDDADDHGWIPVQYIHELKADAR